jgi:hypothetical protein
MPPKADQVKQGVDDEYEKREKGDILKKDRPIKMSVFNFLCVMAGNRQTGSPRVVQ